MLKDEKIELLVDENNTLIIKAPSSQTKIKGITADEFPIIPTVNKDQVFKVSRKDLDIAISQTVFAGKPVAGAIRLRECPDNRLIIVCFLHKTSETGGSRLAFIAECN